MAIINPKNFHFHLLAIFLASHLALNCNYAFAQTCSADSNKVTSSDIRVSIDLENYILPVGSKEYIKSRAGELFDPQNPPYTKAYIKITWKSYSCPEDGYLPAVFFRIAKNSDPLIPYGNFPIPDDKLRSNAISEEQCKVLLGQKKPENSRIPVALLSNWKSALPIRNENNKDDFICGTATYAIDNSGTYFEEADSVVIYDGLACEMKCINCDPEFEATPIAFGRSLDFSAYHFNSDLHIDLGYHQTWESYGPHRFGN